MTGKHALRRDKSKLGGKNTGWVEYGLVGDWNSGGHHWNEESMYLPWVLWGDGASFDKIEAGSLWSADQVAFNYDDPDISAFYLMLMSWNDHENRVKRLAYPGYRNRDTWGLPDAGHMGMLILPEYYYLTGDMRACEAVVNLGQRALRDPLEVQPRRQEGRHRSDARPG